MARVRWLSFALFAVVIAVAAVACGGDRPAQLSLEWMLEDGAAALVEPSESVKSILIVRNEGGADLDAVSLRFDAHAAGQLPVGVSVGTVTQVSSRFEGEDQVWDIGSLGPGDAVAFPMTLWFEATSRTAEPLTVRLVMAADSPSLRADVESNFFEVQVDSRQATGR